MNKEQIQKLLLELKISPNYHLGQNFFINQELLENYLKKLSYPKESSILEIGPGLGALTEVLDKYYDNVLGIEIDRNLYQYLSSNQWENTQIINADILKLNIDELSNYFRQKFIVIANIPYYITKDIILKLLPLKNVEEMVLLVQYDVARKISDNRLDTAFCAIVNYYATPYIDCQISPNCFYPKPLVNSSFLRLVKKVKNQDIEFENFLNFCYHKKRKLLLSTLKEKYPNCQEIFDRLNLSKTIRIQQLSIEDMQLLYKNLEGIK